MQSFPDSGAVQTAISNQELGRPYVAVYQQTVDFNGYAPGPEPPVPSYSAMPLTFKITSAGTIAMKTKKANQSAPAYTRTVPTVSIEVYKNGVSQGIWQSTDADNYQLGTMNVDPGDVITFYGSNYQIGVGVSAYSSYYSSYSTFSGSTAGFEVEGNIMSIINPTGFSAITSYSQYYTSQSQDVPPGVFTGLLRGCTGLTTAENLVLPNDVAPACYTNLFKDSKALVTGPILPATELKDWCYGSMYSGCRSLQNATMLGEEYGGSSVHESAWGESWMSNVPAGGTLYKSPNATTQFVAAPSSWTVLDYNQ